ncbi:MAG TPA: CoA-binding protein [Spirochaetota bacterium]|nr:CoA-binding protein [Spirochaetota bacterium]HOL56121.1 CoA-binding protein [Spirochaetota bacterium]HPP04068.1 CoA-binding protein [Spirochaetota bacterium]
MVVLGASVEPERYSNLVVRLLKEKGENVFPVNPKYNEIEGIKCYGSIRDIKDRIDIITIYINPEKITDDIINQIIDKKPEKVILNPGTEREDLEKILSNNNIKVIKACSIVLLKTNRFI